MSEHNYKVGDKVRFIGAGSHRDIPQFYPPVGTVGTVVKIDHDDVAPYLVQWPVGAAIGGSKFWNAKKDLEPVEVDDESN